MPEDNQDTQQSIQPMTPDRDRQPVDRNSLSQDIRRHAEEIQGASGGDMEALRIMNEASFAVNQAMVNDALGEGGVRYGAADYEFAGDLIEKASTEIKQTMGGNLTDREQDILSINLKLAASYLAYSRGEINAQELRAGVISLLHTKKEEQGTIPPPAHIAPPVRTETNRPVNRIQGPDNNGPSWNGNIVHNLAEWENLVSPDLQTEIELLAELPDNLLNADELRDADITIRGLIRSHHIDAGDMPMAKEFLSRIRELRSNLVESGGSGSGVLERIATSSEQSLQIQKEAFELSDITYAQFVENTAMHVIMFPPKWIEKPPRWYGELNEAQRSMIRTQMHVNFIASRKDAEGSLDAYLRPGAIEGEQDIKIQIESKGLGHAWMNMPGYRIALATLMKELFELSEPDPSVPDRVVVLDADGKQKIYMNNRARNTHLRLRERYSGTGLISGQPELIRQLTANLRSHLVSNPGLLSQDTLTNSPDLAAKAAATFAWNTIFMSGSIDSGDRKGNDRVLAGPHISTDSFRSMVMPLDKAMFKLDKESPQDIEEKWGGQLGDWFADRAIAHGSDFRREVSEGKFHYFPERMFYGWMDYLVLEDKTNINDREQHIFHTSWAQAILRTSRVDLGNGLVDVTDPELLRPDQEGITYSHQGRNWQRSFRDGGSDGDLWWRYSARAGSVRKMYELLTEEDPKSDAGDFATAFSAVVSIEPWLRHIYYDLDFITAVVAKLALLKARANDKSATGFVFGTDELLLNVGEHHYDPSINATLVLLMPRLYKNPAERREAIEYVLQKLHSVNTHTFSGIFKTILGNVGTGRAQIRLRAAKEISQRYK